ncbi:Flp family type IVb pilin [Gluconobacter cerinus]|uniref:Flp family type IVb pilin n=1 Tax=Gluconobacter cerinus TaxID=38307 RepID=UPI001B8D2596|nr:Flp family type IVb pilin [Gluconobacter cerinus]MBS1038120.1 Flp family type IVb pilin [Gluconobacter cerinus]
MRKKFILKDNRGNTAIEYGLLAIGVAVAIISGVIFTGTNVKHTFCVVASAISGSGSCGSSSSNSSGTDGSSTSSAGKATYQNVSTIGFYGHTSYIDPNNIDKSNTFLMNDNSAFVLSLTDGTIQKDLSFGSNEPDDSQIAVVGLYSGSTGKSYANLQQVINDLNDGTDVYYSTAVNNTAVPEFYSTGTDSAGKTQYTQYNFDTSNGTYVKK